jgi:hypothetical protein
MTWTGEVVGSAGPLDEDNLWPLAEDIYTPDLNDWTAGSDKLILMDAEDLKGVSDERD